MKTAEKNNRKQESSNLPFSIGLIVKIVIFAAGVYIWGVDFVRVVVGLFFCYRILWGILSCLVRVGVIIAFIFIVLSFFLTH